MHRMAMATIGNRLILQTISKTLDFGKKRTYHLDHDHLMRYELHDEHQWTNECAIITFL